jgi:hypothetical protein
MAEKHVLTDEIDRILQSINHQPDGTLNSRPEADTSPSTEQETEPIGTIHVYIVREDEGAADEQAVESTLAGKEDSLTSATLPPLPMKAKERRHLFPLVLMALSLLVSVAVIGLFLAPLLRPTATVTLIPVEREMTVTALFPVVSGTPTGEQVQGRFLPALTLTQSQTVPATGKGHQDAQEAQGTLTFYNGLFTSQTVAAGTLLTGTERVQVVTDQPAIIPPALQTIPPTYGRTTVSAHAVVAGSQGNIGVGDINRPCCLPSVIAQNTTAFTGGQDERDYTVVTRQDIDSAATTLKATLTQSMQAALQAQLTQTESLVPPISCTPTVRADHRPGEEAVYVAVMVSEMCMAQTYNRQELQAKATQLVTRKATKSLGADYFLIGNVQATITSVQGGGIRVKAEGVWAYQVSDQKQRQIVRLVVGKSKQQATHLLLNLPGIQGVSIRGIADNASLPTDLNHIHLILSYRGA